MSELILYSLLNQETGEVKDVGNFINLIGPFYRNGEEGLLSTLALNDFVIPDRGPGSRSIRNAIGAFQQEATLEPTTLEQRRQHNQALRTSF